MANDTAVSLIVRTSPQAGIKPIMITLASWTKEMEWYQTGKASVCKHGAYDEFMGLKDGYFCMLRDWRGRIYLRVYFLREDKTRLKKIAMTIKHERRRWGCGGTIARDS
jgi:hypothetical protein